MDRTVKKSDENNKVNPNEKVWVTVSYNCNLGSYESYKLEVGYSETIKPGDDPFEAMNRMIQDVDDTVIPHVETIRTELSNQNPRK